MGTVGIFKQKQAYKKNKGICVICGKPIPDDPKKWSVDHFIPRAVYKWVPDGNIEKQLESSRNIFVVHEYCNFSKDSILPTEKRIEQMHMSDEIKQDLNDLLNTVRPQIEKYRHIKQKILSDQGYRCKFCRRYISFEGATLRRIDNAALRTPENAMCLCASCNFKCCSNKYKMSRIKMITRRTEKLVRDTAKLVSGSFATKEK